jgi:hypothetical protein
LFVFVAAGTVNEVDVDRVTSPRAAVTVTV